MQFEVEVSLPLTIKVEDYGLDSLAYSAHMPGGKRVYAEDLGLTSEDVDTLVLEQIEKESAA